MDLDDFRQNPVDEEGTYRAYPVAWTFEEKESGAAAIHFIFAIQQKWHGKEEGWSVAWAPGWFVENRTWVVKKGGKDLNQGALESLGKCDLWDGDFDKLAGPPPQVYVLLDVQSEEYEGKSYMRAAWINPNADEPQARGGFTPADPNLLAAYRARFQNKTRAIVGGNRAGTPPPPPSANPAPLSAGAAAVAPPTAPAAPAAPPGPPAAPAAPAAPSIQPPIVPGGVAVPPQVAPPHVPAPPPMPGPPPAAAPPEEPDVPPGIEDEEVPF